MTSILDADIPKPFSNDAVFESFVKSECTHIGEGTSRKVYGVHGGKFVVKETINSCNPTCNWIEVVAFLHFEEDRQKLARILSWSASGKFIVMEKLDMTQSTIGSLEFPEWVTDRKPSNVGRSNDGSYKICDYALLIEPDFGYTLPFA